MLGFLLAFIAHPLNTLTALIAGACLHVPLKTVWGKLKHSVLRS